MKLNDRIYDMTIKDVAREFCYNPEWVRQMIRLGVLAPAAIKRRKEYRLNRELVVECLTKAKAPKQEQTQLPITVENQTIEAAVDEDGIDHIDDIEFPDTTFPGVDGLGTGYAEDADYDDIFGDADIHQTPQAYRDEDDGDDDIIFDV